jgi:hypothetical protein
VRRTTGGTPARATLHGRAAAAAQPCGAYPQPPVARGGYEPGAASGADGTPQGAGASPDQASRARHPASSTAATGASSASSAPRPFGAPCAGGHGSGPWRGQKA